MKISDSEEVQIHEKLKIKIEKNDFEDLGSILQLTFIPDHPQNNHSILIAMSFYDQDHLQLIHNKITFLTSSNFILFDNTFLIHSNTADILTLKILNKDINYIKLFNNAIYFSNTKKQSDLYYEASYVIDVQNLTHIIDNPDIILQYTSLNLKNVKNSEKNENFNLIIQELEVVNKSLMQEKDHLEKTKNFLKIREDQINMMILNFKKDIMLYSEKFYNESSIKINSRLNDVSKKLQIAENNMMNKLKIIKEKISSINLQNSKKDSSNHSELSISFKEKIANLEIKNKFMDDSLQDLKKRISEREDIIKNYTENEDKLNRIIKKQKDEIINLTAKIKHLEENLENKNLLSNNTTNGTNQNNPILIKNKKDSQVKKIKKEITLQSTKKIQKQKFGLTKNQINFYTDYFMLDLIISSASISTDLYPKHTTHLNEKDIMLLSQLLLNLALDPIKLFTKFQYVFIFSLPKLVKLILLPQNNSKENKHSLLIDSITNILNTFSDLKSSFLENNSNNSINKEITNGKSLLNLNIKIEKDSSASISSIYLNLNEILIQKINYFCIFIEKNEKRFLEKNNFALSKLILISSRIFKLILSEDLLESVEILKNLLSKYLLSKDFVCINFIISSNYFELVIEMIKITSFRNSLNLEEFFHISLDTLLYLYSIGCDFNKSHIQELVYSDCFVLYLKNLLISGNEKALVVCSLISEKLKNNIYLFEMELKFIKVKNPNQILNNEVMSRNLERIFEFGII